MKNLLMALAVLFLNACAGTQTQEVVFEDEVERCDVDCDQFALALLETRDYESALTVLRTARQHLSDDSRIDAPRLVEERVVVVFQLAVLDVVASNRQKQDTGRAWNELGGAINALVEVDRYRAYSRAVTDFVPKQDRAWFELELGRQKHPALVRYGGLVLLGWGQTLSSKWGKVTGEPTVLSLILANQSAVRGELADAFSIVLVRTVASEDKESLRDLLRARDLLTSFVQTAKPVHEDSLRLLMTTAVKFGIAPFVPIPGPSFLPRKACEIAEPLIGRMIANLEHDVEGLTRMSDCLIRLGRRRLAWETLRRILQISEPTLEVARLILDNSVVGGYRIVFPRKTLASLGTQEDLAVYDVATAKTYAKARQHRDELPDSAAGRFLKAKLAFVEGDSGAALLMLRGLLGEYRSIEVTDMAVQATMDAGSESQLAEIIDSIVVLNPSQGTRLYMDAHLRFGNASGVKQSTEEFMSLDKEGNCLDVMVGLGYLHAVDPSYAWKRFGDWNRWLKARKTGRCPQWVSWYLEQVDPAAHEQRITAMYPVDSRAFKRVVNGSYEGCPEFLERALKLAIDKAEPEQRELAHNKFSWCRVARGKSATPESAKVLAKAIDPNIIDTDAWQLLMAGKSEAAFKRWKEIPADQMPVASLIGTYTAILTPQTTENEWQEQWSRISKEIAWSWKGDSFMIVEWARANQRAGHPERAVEALEFLMEHSDWRQVIWGLEATCSSCRSTFKAKHGHEFRAWEPVKEPKTPSSDVENL